MPDPRPGLGRPRPELQSRHTPPRPDHLGGDAEKTIAEPVASKRSGRIVGVLVGVDGPLDGQIFPVFDGENTVGRGAQCRVRLPGDDRRISREHATLIHRDGVFVIQSKEQVVTRLNDEPTEGSEVKHGDRLTFGDSTFRFLSVY